jgi:hypothetical protein
MARDLPSGTAEINAAVVADVTSGSAVPKPWREIATIRIAFDVPAMSYTM